MLLGDRYHRFSPILPADTKLDDYRQLTDLKNVASSCSLEETERWLNQYWFDGNQ